MEKRAVVKIRKKEARIAKIEKRTVVKVRKKVVKNRKKDKPRFCNWCCSL